MNHSFLPPSGASAWSKCAMWPLMNQKFPQEENAEASEGTAAHWAGWEILADNPCSVGTKAPNGVIVTDEMIEGAELLVDTINWRQTLTDGVGHIEETIAIPGIPDCFGTPDWWSWNPSNCHIEIVDYKFGHRFVDEYFNPQGLLYLTGILAKLKAEHLNWTASFTIVQPRCFYKGRPVRTHSFMKQDALPYIDRLREAAALALLPDPAATTNEHCGNCPGRHSCQALQLAVYNDAEFSNQRSPLTLSPVAAALELRLLTRALERIEARVEGLKEQTLANLRAGHKVNYFRAEPGYGRTQWTIPDSQVVSIGKLFGHDLTKPGVLTPKQAEKAGVDAVIVKANSFTPSTGFRLVAENPNDAARTFARMGE